MSENIGRKIRSVSRLAQYRVGGYPLNSTSSRLGFRRIRGTHMKKKFSAEMRPSAPTSRKSKKSSSSASNGKRGRRPRVSSGIVGRRADYMESTLKRVWISLGPLLLTARTVADVAEALERGSTPHVGPFISPDWYGLVLKILNERSFPKTEAAQIRFLAASLAGWGEVSARRSRDITERERKQSRARHRIIRYEFYVQCTCGYEGPSLGHACRDCFAPIRVDWISDVT